MASKIIFLSHDENRYSGANVALLSFYNHCRVETKFITIKHGRPLIWNLIIRLIKITQIVLKNKNAIYHLNTIDSLDIAIYLHLLKVDYTLHIHETMQYIGVNKIKILNKFRIKTVVVDSRLKNIISNNIQINNLFDLDQLCYKKEYIKNSVVFAIIGTIDENKNQLSALHIFKDLSSSQNDKLLIIGKITDYKYKKILDKYITENSLNVTFAHNIDRQILHSKYDVLLATSNYESYGLAVSEAIAFQKFIIFRDINAYPNLRPYTNKSISFVDLSSKQVQKSMLFDHLEKNHSIHSNCTRLQIEQDRSTIDSINNYYNENFNCNNPFQ